MPRSVTIWTDSVDVEEFQAVRYFNWLIKLYTIIKGVVMVDVGGVVTIHSQCNVRTTLNSIGDTGMVTTPCISNRKLI